jgi:penicillin-binding protein 1A
MPLITEYAKRFGIYDDLLPVLAMSLGAGETTLLRMATAYSMLANGGKQVRATLIDRIQDRWGRSVWKHDARECQGCKADGWSNQEEPEIPDDRKQVLDPHTAYQMTSILEGVVQRGTATVLKSLGRPIAGKTGTTNEERDAWFVGYTPDMVVGVFVGFDTPRPMGKGRTGGGVAAPIFGDFMKRALADQPAAPFRVPPGLKLVRVNLKTGLRAGPGDTQAIVEAFKPNEDPDDAYSIIGFTDTSAATGTAASGDVYQPAQTGGGGTWTSPDAPPPGNAAPPPRPGSVW